MIRATLFHFIISCMCLIQIRKITIIGKCSSAQFLKIEKTLAKTTFCGNFEYRIDQLNMVFKIFVSNTLIFLRANNINVSLSHVLLVEREKLLQKLKRKVKNVPRKEFTPKCAVGQQCPVFF